MWFKNKKDVDLRELQRKGLIKIPKKEVELETDRNGFVDIRSNSLDQENQTQTKQELQEPNQNFFSFMDNSVQENSMNSTNSEDKKVWTRRLEELDNKIYKLEQRIELLERKAGVGNSSGYSWQ